MDLIPNPFLIPVGLIIGVLVAAPVGPVNVLCIQRAIERGFFGGVAAGLGAVLGDGLIAFFAAMGVGAISGAVEHHRVAIQLIGGLALVAFGIKLFLTVPGIATRHLRHDDNVSLKDFIWDIPQTFLLTITNPGEVLGLFAIFGGISTFVEVHTTLEAIVMVTAIMAGSLAWWVFLSNLIGRFRHLVEDRQLRTINRFAGMALVVFGAILIAEVAWKFVTGTDF
jgi:threonine/homoserine/homoserine lactone efflux protein